MSSQVTVYGIPAYGWIPGPDYRAGFDAEGMWSGSQSFYCRKFDFESTPIQTAFRKGVSITTLYPNLTAKWNFLLVDEVDHEHQPNGVTKINVTLKGYSEEWDFDGEGDQSGTFSMNGTLVDRPIIEHPGFLALDANSRGLIVDAFKNRAKRKEGEAKGSSSVTVVSMFDKLIEFITTEDEVFWWNFIIDDGNTTWEASSIEWTKSATNMGGIDPAQIEKLGWIDIPPGAPPVIAPRNWRMTSLTDSQTKAGSETTNDYSITWSMSPPGQVWNAVIYTKP
jgi:hypothetical protein